MMLLLLMMMMMMMMCVCNVDGRSRVLVAKCGLDRKSKTCPATNLPLFSLTL